MLQPDTLKDLDSVECKSQSVRGKMLEKEAVDFSTLDLHRDHEAKSSLFCKDTVHHASICSRAISECDADNYLKFFESNVSRHSLQAVSISCSEQDRYLVARQGESTYYIAFQSETDWPELKSFIKGIRLLSV